MDVIEDRAWLESAIGEAVVGLDRVASGSTRGMYYVTATSGAEYVLRVGDSGGGTAGTELELIREAEAYRALTGSEVPVARLIGIREDGGALLMTKIAGTHDLSGLSEVERSDICDRYIESLATLHRQDTTAFDLPHFRRPATPNNHALNEVATWEAIFRLKALRPSPLVECAISILRDVAPAYHGPTVLCHGDTGPGNFMFHAGRVTGLIDWEFSHLGDPLDDIAWWLFRGHEWLSSGGDPHEQVRRWSAASGHPPEPFRLRYYRCMALLRFYIAGTATLDSGNELQDRLPALRMRAAFEVKLSRALAELIGDPLPLPDRPVLEPAPLAGEAAAILEGNLDQYILPDLQGRESQRRGRSAIELVRYMAAVDRFGDSIRKADRQDFAEIAGGQGETAEATNACLTAFARSDRRDQMKLLRYSLRSGARHAMLWANATERAFQEPIYYKG